MRLSNLLISICLLICVSTATAQPQLKIRNERFEMGSIPEQSVVGHAFWFVSTGTDTLVITEIKTGCSCTMMPLESDRIAPGDSMLVDFCWDIKRRLGATGSYPYIFTNEGGEPHRVYLTGTIRNNSDTTFPVAFMPHRFELSRFGNHSVDSIGFKVHNFSKEELRITQISNYADECEINLPEMVPPEDEAFGYIKVKEQYLDTEFKRSITVMFDKKNKSLLTVPIRRKIY